MRTTFKRIHTPDNLELHGILYEPEVKTNKILLHVHGMGGNFYENKFIDSIAKSLTENGIALAVFNNRGAELMKDLIQLPNNSIVRAGTAYEKFEDCLIDIKTYIDVLEDIGFGEIHIAGHSLGCPKVAYYASETKDERIKSISFISPSDMLGLVRQDGKRFELENSEAREMIANNQASDLMSLKVWDEHFVSAGTYISLFGDESKAGIFNFYKKDDDFKSLKNITSPVFAVMGKKDDVLVIPIEDIFSKLKLALSASPKVKTVILGDATHGYRGYEQALADEITNWLMNYSV